ncbi:uncharacterized protein LOC111642880 [Copidosoma floridanum]|uniref:uncharacterized protein LOC111642880 n=1 Tax=Copidosoma floridanum TaxID=29053 RepID=UPI000C6F8051|nr:uncharacterized protein LOC111642880 [Copidosoma floridanum]
MYLPPVILCAFLITFSKAAAVIDYTNITPWSVVYLVYPIYESDLWVDNITPKTKELSETPDNAIVLQRHDNQGGVLQKEVQGENNNSQQTKDRHEPDNERVKNNYHIPVISWPPDYKNWPKSTNKPEH